MTMPLQRSLASGPTWKLTAHTALSPPPSAWRDELVQMLGHRPRRLGEWTELVLFGALTCLREAGEERLPPQARVRLFSQSGPMQAQADTLAQLRGGLPMPFSFMQGQPAIALAALAQALRWQGDAAFLTVRGATDLSNMSNMSLRGASPEGVLIGRVEHGQQGSSCEWWRFVSASQAP